jgi:tRNA pseudouridine65 synthase
MLEILYQDTDLVAINKPHGLLVHRTNIALDANEFSVQLLRDQIGQTVYPVHRLDRKTAGVLLFALSKKVNSAMQVQFMEGLVKKQYLAIVRGFTADETTIDYALTREDGKVQDAVTHFKTISKSEIDLPHGKFETSRYSLIDVFPETGRMHQIRKHMAHLRHPIIGDRPHGCNKQNKLFLEKFSMNTMMLHARQLSFSHPVTKVELTINAHLKTEFYRMVEVLKLDYPQN